MGNVAAEPRSQPAQQAFELAAEIAVELVAGQRRLGRRPVAGQQGVDRPQRRDEVAAEVAERQGLDPDEPLPSGQVPHQADEAVGLPVGQQLLGGGGQRPLFLEGLPALGGEGDPWLVRRCRVS